MNAAALGPHCPRWCPNNHGIGWKIHARNCGEVTAGDVTYSIDAVKYRDDEPEMVSFCVYTPDEARVSNHTADEARRIYEALGVALALIAESQGQDPAASNDAA
jgi:hypothetical protein